jgi:hypothetical protein
VTISRLITLRMRNGSNIFFRNNKNSHFMFNSFFPENRVSYEKVLKNAVDTEKQQMTICRRVTCWISKATRVQAHASAREPTPIHIWKHAHARTHPHAGTHTQKHVILTAFPRQRYFQERASVLRYTYIAPHFCFKKNTGRFYHKCTHVFI